MALGLLLSAVLALLASDVSAAMTFLRTRRQSPRPSRGRTVLSAAEVRQLVDHYATLYKIPLSIARNLVTVESAWRQGAVSPVGALGLTQLMPGTARELRVNPYDSRQNIEGGMRYLARQHQRFRRWELALAAYNTGPGRVAQYGGVPPWTQRYVRLITGRPLPGSAWTPAVAKAPARPAIGANLQALVEAMVEFPAGVRRSKSQLSPAFRGSPV
ncbi:MAG: hypothetical protein A2V59_10620 [Armatimonadetes bacterium RBG_19FT_COMBO_69_19]|nr:MAG: hypothetical protein A2V59_10620 [Armatimonadetes bacterium RBG_19FT_COMBO_69_19]